MSHRKRGSRRARAVLCGFSAAGAGPSPFGGDSFDGNHDDPGRRHSLSVTYDFGGDKGLPPRR
jgi:hypothetical protein